MTGAYNLPSRHVLHTVGPIVQGQVTKENRRDLESCYRSCLELAMQQLGSIAFSCISAGEFHFPHWEAAEIAVTTVKEILGRTGSRIKVIINVFQEEDACIYREYLSRL